MERLKKRLIELWREKDAAQQIKRFMRLCLLWSSASKWRWISLPSLDYSAQMRWLLLTAHAALLIRLVTANMKYHENIKNDNKNMKSIRYAKSYRRAQYSHGLWCAGNTEETKNASCLLIILLMHDIVRTIDDVQ